MLGRVISRALMAFCLAVLTLTAQANETADAAIHEELRTLLQDVVKAVNAREYDQLAQYFDPNMRVTTINQEVLLSPSEIRPYFEKWFGPGRFLKSVQMTLDADRLTELNTAKDSGVVFGTGTENYVLADGRHYDMQTHWTASVSKGPDGKWRILTLHIGTNFLDNPLLNEIEKSLLRFTIGAGVIGLLLGFVLGWLLKRRKLQK